MVKIYFIIFIVRPEDSYFSRPPYSFEKETNKDLGEKQETLLIPFIVSFPAPPPLREISLSISLKSKIKGPQRHFMKTGPKCGSQSISDPV